MGVFEYLWLASLVSAFLALLIVGVRDYRSGKQRRDELAEKIALSIKGLVQKLESGEEIRGTRLHADGTAEGDVVVIPRKEKHEQT